MPVTCLSNDAWEEYRCRPLPQELRQPQIRSTRCSALVGEGRAYTKGYSLIAAVTNNASRWLHLLDAVVQNWGSGLPQQGFWLGSAITQLGLTGGAIIAMGYCAAIVAWLAVLLCLCEHGEIGILRDDDPLTRQPGQRWEGWSGCLPPAENAG